MTKEQAVCWEGVAILEMVFSTATTKSGLPPWTQRLLQALKMLVVSFFLVTNGCKVQPAISLAQVYRSVCFQGWKTQLWCTACLHRQCVMVCYMCMPLVKQKALERPTGWKCNSQDGLAPLPPEVMCVQPTTSLQHASHFHPLYKLLQVLYWTKVMFLINLGYLQPMLHCEPFCSSW